MDGAHLDQFELGIRLFNQEAFYECHDTIEEIWLQESSDEQPFLQGIIQSAVAFHHYQHGKWGAARSMFQLAIEKLENYPDSYGSVSLKELLRELRHWKAALDRAISQTSQAPPALPFPKILITRDGRLSG